MSLRKKVAYILLAISAVQAAMYYVIQCYIVYPSFVTLEREEAGKNVARAIEALQRELELLEPSATDWSRWDETYRFVEDQNEAYANANLNTEAVLSLKIHFLGLYTLDGHRLWGRAIDPDTKETMAVDAFLPDHLSAGHPLRTAQNATDLVSGIVHTPSGPALFVSHPILTSAGEGPSRGNVVMARRLDAAAIDRIAAQTRIALSTQSIDAAGNTPSTAATTAGRLPYTPIHMKESASSWTGSTVLHDLVGQPALQLAVATPRDITARGDDALQLAGVVAIVTGGVILVIIQIALRRTLIDPLTQLTHHVAAIGDNDDLSVRIGTARKDEIGVLAREFDRMVEHLADARQRLREQSYQAGVAEMASGVLHNIGNAITPVGVKLTRLRSALEQAPVREIDIASAELADPTIEAGRRADMHSFLALASQEMSALLRRTTGDLDAVHRQFDHIQQILADQQRFSRTERVMETVAVAALLIDTIKLLPEALCERLQVELAADVAKMPPISAARVALQQVVSNLLINAAEAIPPRGSQYAGQMYIDAMEETVDGIPMVHLRFADNGAGIAPEHLRQLFERGFSTKQRGSGTGLHWTANTVQALGGRLHAESAGAGQGACFHLLLPQAITTTVRATLEDAA